jgi:hypothetical protein
MPAPTMMTFIFEVKEPPNYNKDLAAKDRDIEFPRFVGGCQVLVLVCTMAFELPRTGLRRLPGLRMAFTVRRAAYLSSCALQK